MVNYISNEPYYQRGCLQDVKKGEKIHERVIYAGKINLYTDWRDD